MVTCMHRRMANRVYFFSFASANWKMPPMVSYICLEYRVEQREQPLGYRDSALIKI